MPRLGYMIVDGLASVLVGVGLIAAIIGYVHNLPDPSAPAIGAAAMASSDMDPETTGSITPKDKTASAGKASSQRRAKADEVDLPSASGPRTWTDPPRR